MLDPSLIVPHHGRIRQFLEERIHDIKESVLRDLPTTSKVSIAIDCWTSPTNYAFLAMVGYFIDVNWKFREVLLAFEPLHGSHTGPNLARYVRTILARYDLEDRLFALTNNNASNNATMARALAATCSEFNNGYHLPCLAHTIQLGIKDLMANIKISATNEDAPRGWRDDIASRARRQPRRFTRTIEKVRQLSI